MQRVWRELMPGLVVTNMQPSKGVRSEHGGGGQ